MQNKFALDEFFRGTAATLILIPLLGVWGFVLAPATGLLWMLGGTYSKAIRRFGVPFAAFVFMAASPYSHKWLAILASFIGIGILHLGDGFPDHREFTEDEGSWLGRLVEKYIDKRDSIGGPITKWIVVLLFQASLVPYWMLR